MTFRAINPTFVESDANALVDTGFLVALCDRRDQWHGWATARARAHRGPWLTCEACVTELDHLLGFLVPPQSLRIYELLADGTLQSLHFLPEQLAGVSAEISRYRGRRVDFADACMVVLSDTFPKLPLITVDSDFAIYLRGRAARRLVAPSK